MDRVRRGDLVTIALQGDFGKPRPALVIQADQFDDTATVTLLMISTDLVEAPLFRLNVGPTDENNLRAPSQIMIDKAMTVYRTKVGRIFGRVDDGTMLVVNRSLALFLGFA